jgi:phospholipid/cholesterol/gamma-HCH transport system permease protein
MGGMKMLSSLGRIAIFVFYGIVGIFANIFSKNRLIKRTYIEQLYSFGVKSFPMVFIVSIFTGMVLIIQLVPEFKKFGAQSFTGGAISLAISRELGPTLTAVIIAGRVGSAITAELGSMKVSEQIAALEVMAVNPIRYLVSPRIFSGIIMLPALTIVADFLGIFGGYMIGVHKMGLVSGVYLTNMGILMDTRDIFGGLVKSLFFGIIITSVACYKGMNVKGGSEGVGTATTDSVVLSIMLILIFNFFLSYFIFGSSY